MANGNFVAYFRVSTAKQGRSGLGLEAQQEAVHRYLNGGQWSLIAGLVEVESGKRNDRPKLAEALRLCRLHRATLIIAKLDRLARNTAFIANLMESGVDFVAVDFPQANKLTVHILAAVAEHEAAMISKRTKDALAAAKARGVKLGGDPASLSGQAQKGALASAKTRGEKASAHATDILPMIDHMRVSGASLRQMAAELTAKSIPTARGGSGWTAMAVKRLLDRGV